MADRSEAPHPWRRALAWLAFLGPFFFATYAFANWTASLHTAVPSIVFDWERHIPFLPWTIVPYWIIDALYGISLFLCASKRELDTHALRLLTAQVVAVACFIAFSHRFTFAHPPADGVFGAKTISALRTFQSDYMPGKKANGIADMETQFAILDEFENKLDADAANWLVASSSRNPSGTSARSATPSPWALSSSAEVARNTAPTP